MRNTLPLMLLLLVGCARSEDASVVADMNELQPVERVRTPEQDDEDIALGQWRETLQDDNAALEFGPTGTAPLFSLRCDARRSLFLQRHGAAPSGDLPMMLVTIGSETRRLAVTSAGGTVPTLRASLAPSDPLVETLASASSPITIRVGDALPLGLPPAPEISTFLERCATGEQAGGGNEAENGSAPANEVAPTAAPANGTAPAAER
jgi:hypothetical protein